jgi:hypothetical protein
MWWFIVPVVLVLVSKNMNKCAQKAQYCSVQQPVGTRVLSGFGFNRNISAAPLGPCTIAKAQACTPFSVQSRNPKTPTVCNSPNSGRPPVPTGIFILDSGLNRVSGVVEIATSDTWSIQFYNTAKQLLGQVEAVPNGVTVFNYSQFSTVERAVLIGPGGSTVVMNNPATWVQAGIGQAPIASTCGAAFQDKTTPMVGALCQSVPCSGFDVFKAPLYGTARSAGSAA